MSNSSPSTPTRPPLPPSVEQLIQSICAEQCQTPPDAGIRRQLGQLGEEASLQLLKKISAQNIRNLSGYIAHMIKQARGEATGTTLSSPSKRIAISPTLVSSPSPSPITRRLKGLASSERAQALYQCSGRSSPELLNYLPTYKCWLKKKPAKARKPRKGKHTTVTSITAQERAILEAQLVGELRGKVRAPVDRASPDPSDSEGEMPPKIDLAARLAEMSAKTTKAPSKRREKPSSGFVPPKDPATGRSRVSISEEERPAKKSRDGSSPAADSEGLVVQPGKKVPEIEVLTRPWSPALINTEGRSIMSTDSVHADTRLGLGLLPALALKNDMAMVPSKLEDNLYHCSSLVVQTGQSMLRLHDQVLELSGAAKKYKSRADAALEKVQTAESRAEELRAENERLKKELAEGKERSDRRLEKMRAEHQKVLEEAKQEAYNAGFAEAGEAYAGDILKLVKDGEQKGFGKGYLYCCEVFGIPAEDPRREAPEMPDSPMAEDAPEDEEEAEDDGTPIPEKSEDVEMNGKTPLESTAEETVIVTP